MTVFESLNNTTDKASDTAERYVKTSKDYLKLKIFQQLTVSLSLVAKFAIIGSMLILALIFMAVAAAIALGELFGSLPLGYVAVGFIFVVFAIIGYSQRHKIETKIIKTLSVKFFDQ